MRGGWHRDVAHPALGVGVGVGWGLEGGAWRQPLSLLVCDVELSSRARQRRPIAGMSAGYTIRYRNGLIAGHVGLSGQSVSVHRGSDRGHGLPAR